MWEGRAQQHRPLGPEVLSGSLLVALPFPAEGSLAGGSHTSLPLSQLPVENKAQDVCSAPSLKVQGSLGPQ